MAKDGREFVEEELAFRLKDPKCFPELVEKLWTASGLIEMNGVMVTRIGEEIKGAVHIFSDKTQGDQKERLRLSAGKNGLTAKLDRKRLVGRVKFEKSVKSTDRKKDVVHLMNQVQPAISMFCKERATLTYKFLAPAGDTKSQDRHFTIGIDRIVAIPTSDDSSAKCFSFYDVDIEGDGSGSERQFATSAYFKEQLRGLLQPLERSTAKWRVAREASAGSKPKKMGYKTYEEVQEFFVGCMAKFREVFPTGCSLAGPAAKRR